MEDIAGDGSAVLSGGAVAPISGMVILHGITTQATALRYVFTPFKTVSASNPSSSNSSPSAKGKSGSNSQQSTNSTNNNNSSGTGSYTNTHKTGKKYHGKGDQGRAAESAKEKADFHNDPLVSTDWTPAPNEREAFKQENARLEADGGHRSPTNYNKRASPGKRYEAEDQAKAAKMQNAQQTQQSTTPQTSPPAANNNQSSGI